MKLSDNMTLLLGVILNILKDVAVLSIFAYLCIHFNNIWIILFGLCFVGGYNIRLNYKNNKEEGEEKKNG